MLKLLAAFRKEFLILVRDIPGLLIVFLMPLMLIMIVTLAQEKALKNQSEPVALLLSIPPGSTLGAQIRNDIRNSGFFTIGRDSLSPGEVVYALARGQSVAGIILYPCDTSITLVMDPTLHEAFQNSIRNSALFLLKGAEATVAMKKLLAMYSPVAIPADPDAFFRSLPPIRQTFAIKDRSFIIPTPVQNNIPGFILFAMFFIVIPISGSLISEKNEGSFLRLKTLPVPVITVLGSKVILYILVCLMQFLLMFLAGLFLFHALFDFPPLKMGSDPAALVISTLTAALAAVGFGILVGTGSKSHGQAALFGSVMVLILGIISGCFFPIHIMPEVIQSVSRFSPIRWGIDNYLELFIRDGRLPDILLRSLWLLLFFIFALLGGMIFFIRRK
jgi:ABC-2 type transport system permease protein